MSQRSLVESEGSSNPTALRVRSLVLAIALIAFAFSARAEAQSTLSGKVTDPSGAPAPGATVDLVELASGKAKRTTTGAAGDYKFAGLSLGVYSVTVGLQGYRRTTVSLTLDAPKDLVLNVPLDQMVLEEVVISATRNPQEIGNVPAAITVLTSQEIHEDRKAINLEESLKSVPGVRVEDEMGGSDRARIIIRGNGTRANSPAGSGVRSVRVIVDGVPKNNAGGSAQDLTDIDLEAVERIEVLRGPSSALYGNQSGGVVNIITEEGSTTPVIAYRQTVGSYGLFREHLKVGGESGNVSYMLNGFRTDIAGYRAQSLSNDMGFHAKLRLTIDDKSSLSGVVSFDHQFQQSPGQITKAAFDQDPRQADPRFSSNNVHSVVEEQRLGLTYRRQLFEQGTLEISGYYSPRHLGPFQQIGVRIPQDFTNRGASLRYLHSAPIAGMANRLTVGTDYQNTPITTGVFNSTTGAAVSNTEEHASTFGAYALEELSLLPNLIASVGGRFDTIDFSSEDLVKAKGVSSRTYQRFTPKIAVTFRPVPTLSAYASFSQGFEAPVIGELRTLPGGAYGFNSALNPQTSDNYEAGARGDVLDDRVGFEVALFRQNIHDLISPNGAFPNNSFQNVGGVREYGAEAGTQVRIVPGLTLRLTYTYSDFIFQNYTNGPVDYSGNRLPGVPQSMFVGNLRYRHPIGFHVGAEVQTVSRLFFDNANTASNAAYALLNLRAGYDWNGSKFHLTPFVSVNNVTDTKYSAFGLINDSRGNFYNPLPGITVFGGLGIQYDYL